MPSPRWPKPRQIFQVVDGVAIYLGVMPAQIVQGHPKEHPEVGMHGGAPTRGDRVHVVVALFDNATGGRILHHFKRLLKDHRTTVLFTGFQAGGTRGAKMLEAYELAITRVNKTIALRGF